MIIKCADNAVEINVIRIVWFVSVINVEPLNQSNGNQNVNISSIQKISNLINNYDTNETFCMNHCNLFYGKCELKKRKKRSIFKIKLSKDFFFYSFEEIDVMKKEELCTNGYYEGK